MKDIYRTVNSYGEDEITINKSRFIGYSYPINTEEEAIDFIHLIKSKHKDATHNVYAYVVGEDSNIQRFNDDGEPSGTAGIPVLEVIKKEGLRNLVVVITRYYGGIKLGGGGLIRAYTKGAKIALDAGIICEMTLHKKVKIILPYTLIGKIENYLMTNNYRTEEVIYKEDVEICVYVMNSISIEFEKDIMNLTSGNALLSNIDEVHLPIVEGRRIYSNGV